MSQGASQSPSCSGAVIGGAARHLTAQNEPPRHEQWALPCLKVEPTVGSARASRMAFLLFVLANVTLLVRPMELLPQLAGWPVYEALIAGCLLAALPVVLIELSPDRLLERPITACVVGLIAAVAMSHLAVGYVWGARMSGVEFAKVALYYLLLVATVNTAARLRAFLIILAGLAVVTTGLAVLHFHGAINIPALAALEYEQVDDRGETITLKRLVSTGILNDPNDLSLLIVMAMLICTYGIAETQRGWVARGMWLAPLGLLGYAMTLTNSRGGFLALMAGVTILLATRLGWKKGMLLAPVVVAGMFTVFAGRQADLSTTTDTAQQRIQIWSEGLALLRENPIFGIGYGNFDEEVGHVAHNSFVHAFAELGFFGGALFAGAFFLAIWGMWRMRGAASMQPQARGLRPYLLAITGAYAVGCFSLSRSYVVPTYMVLGMAAAYARIGAAGVAPVRLSTRLVMAMAAVGVGLLGAIYVFIRIFVRWS